MSGAASGNPSICFVGMENLPVLAPEYSAHPIGGEQVQHTLLARALTRAGYDVSMVVGDYGQPDGARWDGIRTFKAYRPSAGVPVLRFAHPRWTGLWSAARRANADVYYVSCAGSTVGELASFARMYGRRVIFRIASDSDCEPDKLLIARDALGVQHWLHKSLYFYGIRRAHAVLAQSRHQQALLQRHFGLPSTVVPMLVDFPPGIAPYEQRTLAALWVSNIRPVKRPDLALELARATPAVELTMAGGALGAYAQLYRQIEAGAAALPNVRFLGRTSYRQTGELFGRARVFVNTSDVEGFPNTFLQAWANGTPVVSFFDPDGLIRREGLGHAVRDLAEMSAATAALVHDPQQWAQTSARCRAYAQRHAGEDRIVGSYREIIGQLGTERLAS